MNGKVVKTVSFIILTWNSERYIKNCLEAISKIKNIDAEIVVVDNGSSDSTVKVIKTLFPNVLLIQLNKNYGTTYPRNLGLKKSNPNNQYICILDSDTIIGDEAINNLMDCLEIDNSYMISVPQMHNSRGEYQISYKRFPSLCNKLLKAFPFKKINEVGQMMESYRFTFEKMAYEVDYGISACWMMKREVLQLAGYLDESIFYSPEDVDYCATVWKNGGKVILATDSMIIHDTQRISKKKLVSRHNISHIFGLVYYFWKHKYLFSADKIRKTSENI